MLYNLVVCNSSGSLSPCIYLSACRHDAGLTLNLHNLIESSDREAAGFDSV